MFVVFFNQHWGLVVMLPLVGILGDANLHRCRCPHDVDRWWYGWCITLCISAQDLGWSLECGRIFFVTIRAFPPSLFLDNKAHDFGTRQNKPSACVFVVAMASISCTSWICERVSRIALALGCLPPRQRSGSFWLFADHWLGKTWRCCNTKLLDACSRDHRWISSSVIRLRHVRILTAWSRANDTSQGFCLKSETDCLPYPYPLDSGGNVTSTFFNVLYPKGVLYLGCKPYAVDCRCSLTSSVWHGLTSALGTKDLAGAHFFGSPHQWGWSSSSGFVKAWLFQPDRWLSQLPGQIILHSWDQLGIFTKWASQGSLPVRFSESRPWQTVWGFIRYFILEELAKDVDGYAFSNYVAQQSAESRKSLKTILVTRDTSAGDRWGVLTCDIILTDFVAQLFPSSSPL